MKSNPEIIIIFIFLSLAFLLERKPLNLILNFVGILISLAFIISNEFPEAQYFSFILIIVYTSALSILFGFIIMLNPNNMTLIFNKLNQPQPISENNNNIKQEYSSPYLTLEVKFISRIYNIITNNIILIIFLFSSFFFIFWFYSNPQNFLGGLWDIYFTENKYINSFIKFYNILAPTKLLKFSEEINSFQEIEILPVIEIIEKTGRNIYSCPNTIFNFIIAILILLLALLSLFFLL